MSIVKLAMEGHFEKPTKILSMEEMDEMGEEVEAAEVEVVQDLDEAEKALGIIGALEDLAFVATTIEDVKPREAALIQIAADASMLNTGVDSTALFPAMEDMGTGKEVAGRITEVIKRIVAEIKSLLTKVLKVIQESISKVIQIAASRRNGDARDKLSKELTALKSNASVKVTTKALFTHGRALSTYPEMLKMITGYEAFVNLFERQYVSFAENVCKGALTVYGVASKSSSSVATVLKELSKSTSGLESKFFNKTSSHEIDSDSGIDLIEEIYGDKGEVLGALRVTKRSVALKSHTTQFAESGFQEAAKVFRQILNNMGVNVTRTSSNFREESEITVPSPEQLRVLFTFSTRLLDSCTKESMAGTLAGSSTHVAELVKKTTDIITRKIMMADPSDLNIQPFVSEALHVTNALMNNVAAPYNAVIASTLQLSARIDALVEASIKAHKAA